jgi:circadian clock protein KaiB
VAGSDLEVKRVWDALEKVCQEHVPGRYRIALVDILLDPEQADAFDIVAAPTLIRQSPLPVRRVIGDLSQVTKVLTGLGIPVPQEP